MSDGPADLSLVGDLHAARFRSRSADAALAAAALIGAAGVTLLFADRRAAVAASAAIVVACIVSAGVLLLSARGLGAPGRLGIGARLRERVRLGRAERRGEASVPVAAGIGAPGRGETRWIVIGAVVWCAVAAVVWAAHPRAPVLLVGFVVPWLGWRALGPSLRRLRHGSLVVGWPGGVPRVGVAAEFTVGTTPGGASIDHVRIVLRCVREIRGGWLASWLVPFELWHAAARLDRAAHLGPESFQLARIEIPADLPPTDLAAAEPVYWEVLVLGRLGERNVMSRVMVPVRAVPVT